MKKIITLLLILTACLTAFACTPTENTATLTGKITSAYGVDFETVTLKTESKTFTNAVNADGSYSITLPYGVHTLTAETGNCRGESKVIVDKTTNPCNIALNSPYFRLGNQMTVNGITVTGEEIDDELANASESGRFRVPTTGQLHLFPNSVSDDDFILSATFEGTLASMMGIGLTDGQEVLSFQAKAWGKSQLAVELSAPGEQGFDFSTANIPSNQNTVKKVILTIKKIGKSVEVYVGTARRKVLTATENGYITATGVEINWSHSKIGVSSGDDAHTALNKVNTAHAPILKTIFADGKQLGLVFMRNSTSDGNNMSVSLKYEKIDTSPVSVNLEIPDEIVDSVEVTFKSKNSADEYQRVFTAGEHSVRLPNGTYEVQVKTNENEYPDSYYRTLDKTISDFTVNGSANLTIVLDE